MQNKPTTANRTMVWLDIENLLLSLFPPHKRVQTRLDITPIKKALRQLTNVAAMYAYGDFSHLSYLFRCDVEQILRDLGIITHHRRSIRGKNSADMAIATAIHIALVEHSDLSTVVIASGDSDFCPVAEYVRFLKKKMILITPSYSSSRHLKELANRVIYLDSNWATTIKDQGQMPRTPKHALSYQ